MNPTERSGAGPADYVLVRDGAEVWRGRLEVTLREAVVSDDGAFGGFALTRGSEQAGFLSILVVGPDGMVRGEHRQARKAGPRMHTFGPSGRGVFLQDDPEVLVVRFHGLEGSEGEVWWRFRLGDGQRLEDALPSSPLGEADSAGRGRIVDTEPIAGTDLVLTQWYEYERDASRGAFAVLGPDGALLWRSPETVSSDTGLSSIRPFGALLPSGGEGAFAYWSTTDRARIDLFARRTEARDGWAVDELRRTPADPPWEDPELEPVPLPRQIELSRLQPVELGAAFARPPSPFGQVHALGTTDDGRLELISARSDGLWHLELDREGGVEREDPIGAFDETGMTSFIDGSATTWWRVFQTFDDEKRLRIDSIDVRSGDVSTVRETSKEKFIAAVADGDGLLLRAGGRLIALDGRGEERWSIEGGGLGSELVVTEHTIVLLDRFRNRLRLLQRENGSDAGTVELEAAWGRKPGYAAGLLASGPDQVLVGDRSSWYRTSLDGALLERIEPRLADGQVLEFARFQTDPQGVLWCWSGRHESLYWLDAQGIATPFGSEPASTEEIGRALRATIDPLGRILIQDEATGAIHAFDVHGRRSFVSEVEPSDFPDGTFFGDPITVDGSGQIYAPTEGKTIFDEGVHMHLDERGRRLGKVSLKSDVVFLVPGTQIRWERDFPAAYRRRQPDGRVDYVLQRRADGRWYTDVSHLAIARDGSLAALEYANPERTGDAFDANIVSIYAPDGGPRLSTKIAGPVSDFVLSSSWLFARAETKGLLFSLEEREWRSFDLGPTGERGRWALGFSMDETELWALELSVLTLHRWKVRG